MMTITVSSRKITVKGRVTDSLTKTALSGAQVEIVQGPQAFLTRRDIMARHPDWDRSTERYGRTAVRADGSYYFVDLPTGVYRLQASAPGMGTRYGTGETGNVRVWAGPDADGRVKLSPADIAVPPTHIKGRATNKETGVAIEGAKARLRGDGQVVLTDQDGQYVLGPIAAGSPTLEISAKGFQTEARKVSLSQGAGEDLNLTLAPV